MNARPRQRRGFVLIVALVVTFALASLVLTLGRLARTESLASTNQLAAYEAAAVERGAEQYVLTALDSDNVDSLGTLTDDDWAQVPVGKGYFWVVRPDYLDNDLPQFGLVDEASKIPLNGMTYDQLMALDNMDQDTAQALVDWSSATADGGNLTAPLGAYRNKGGPYETTEEMLMVPGVTRELYFGDDAMTRMGNAPPTTLAGNDALRAAGWQNYFTAWRTMGQATTVGRGITIPPAPEIAINTAPRDALIALFETAGLTSSDVDTLLSSRASAVQSDPTDVTWASTALPSLGTLQNRFVARSNFFSADIVATSGNGRAFRRVRIVVDASQTPPQIVYRRDVTTDGFPLDASVLDDLRNGTLPANAASTSASSSGIGGKL